MEELHTTFIYTIVDYFNATYSTTLSARNAIEKLLPPKPDYSCLDKKLIEDYHKKMVSLTICYEDVVEILISQLNGRSFTEQAFHELAAKCHFAAWNIYQKKPEFVRQKNIIRFSENGCRVRNRSHCDRWELCDSLKNVLRGVAHFETKCFRVYPLGFSELLGHTGVYDNEQEFPTCEKLRGLKMFKNGRVDLKFSTEDFAKAFVRDYLGLVC